MNVVADAAFQNWILGAMVRESASHSKECIDIHYIKSSRIKYPFHFLYKRFRKRLNLGENDLIVNHKLLEYLLKSNLICRTDLPFLRCLFTHESEDFLVNSNLINVLKSLRRVLVMNKSDAELLQRLGVESKNIAITYGAINRKIFFPLEQYIPNRKVLITGDAKGRKNPGKIIQTINENPDIDFEICGRYWEKLILNNPIPNGNYFVHEFSIQRTAYLMRNCSAYLTLSTMEGGPFPLLEALASGTPVVTTLVGWAPEIVNESNGVLVNHDATIADVSEAIERCFKVKHSVWNQDLLKGEFTWDELALKLYGS